MAILILCAYIATVYLAHIVLGAFGAWPTRFESYVRHWAAIFWPIALCVWALYGFGEWIMDLLCEVHFRIYTTPWAARLCDTIALIFSPYGIGQIIREKVVLSRKRKKTNRRTRVKQGPDLT